LVEAVEDIEVGDPKPLRGRSDGGEGRELDTIAGAPVEGRRGESAPWLEIRRRGGTPALSLEIRWRAR
jgi:hypothetical protein